MLRSENMPDTYKMQVCWLNYTKMMLLFRRQVPYWCVINMVNEPLQPRQTRKGDNLTKKRRHQRSADPQQDKELVEALFKLALCIITMVVS